MEGKRKIKTALISVYHKDGLEEILTSLKKEGVKFLSTGGTHDFIEHLGYRCKAVDEVTNYPAILGGRVKTLHPKIFGGILARRHHHGDRVQMTHYDIKPIDLVIVDLYPFEDTVEHHADPADIIENIDVGGIALIRAAAKNFEDVVVVASKEEYPILKDILEREGAHTSREERRELARRAFQVTSQYDTDIKNWFEESK